MRLEGRRLPDRVGQHAPDQLLGNESRVGRAGHAALLGLTDAVLANVRQAVQLIGDASQQPFRDGSPALMLPGMSIWCTQVLDSAPDLLV